MKKRKEVEEEDWEEVKEEDGEDWEAGAEGVMIG